MDALGPPRAVYLRRSPAETEIPCLPDWSWFERLPLQASQQQRDFPVEVADTSSMRSDHPDSWPHMYTSTWLPSS